MKVSLVVLNYGYHDFVFECLGSIDRMRKREHSELILVDNGSTGDEWSRIDGRLREGYRIDKCVRLRTNQGFAVGMNAGAAVADGEWIVMLNSDTVVGDNFVEQILAADAKVNASTVGFLALPVYDWRYNAVESVLTHNWQADVAALTCYASCMPVRYSEIKPRFALGPPGPVVIISTKLIRALKQTYGCVYDPHFFMYGEDVDLFLRAKRLGFDTCFLPGNIERGEVIWHMGSGTSGGSDSPAMRTITKEPAVARRILDGMYDNVISHAGWAELIPLLLIQSVFRLIFYFTYALKKSPRAMWQLLRVSRERRPAASARKHPRVFGLWLSRYIAVGRRAPMLWARSARAG
jgi:GT2 family glycosyltransferase